MEMDGRMNSEKFIAFLKRLIHNASNPIPLIVDGRSVHKSKKVRAFVDSTRGRLVIFILQPHSPHLNPDEPVRGYLEHHKPGKMGVARPDELKAKVFSVLKSIRKMPPKIDAFYGKRAWSISLPDAG